jgi:hypothetical protein
MERGEDSKQTLSLFIGGGGAVYLLPFHFIPPPLSSPFCPRPASRGVLAHWPKVRPHNTKTPNFNVLLWDKTKLCHDFPNKSSKEFDNLKYSFFNFSLMKASRNSNQTAFSKHKSKFCLIL